MSPKSKFQIALVYFALVTLAVAQPLFNVVVLFRREFDMGYLQVALIVFVFQYVLAALLFGLRLLLVRWAGMVDSLVVFAFSISIIRQIQQMYLATGSLSSTEKYFLVTAMAVAAVLLASVFRKWVFKFFVPVGVISPIFGFYFIYVISQLSLPLTFPNKSHKASENAGPPIYLIALDELSIPILLNDQGQIDPKRYPNLSSFSKDSVWYRQAVTHHIYTEYAFLGMMTGRFPTNESTIAYAADIESIPQQSLWWELSKRGYAVHLYESFLGCGAQQFDCKKFYSKNSPFFLWRVFSKFVETFGPDFLVYRWFPFFRGEVFEEEHAIGMDYARGGGNGNFYFLHRFISHAPYIYDASGEYHFSKDHVIDFKADFEAALERYRQQLQYLDKQFGEFIATLKESGAYEKAIIAVTSDHGNCWTKNCPGRIGGSKITVVESSLPRVLTFIRSPGSKPRIDDGDFQIVDIFPTIMDAAKISIPYVDQLDGRSGLNSTYPIRARPFSLGPLDKPIYLDLPVKPVSVPEE